MTEPRAPITLTKAMGKQNFKQDIQSFGLLRSGPIMQYQRGDGRYVHLIICMCNLKLTSVSAIDDHEHTVKISLRTPVETRCPTIEDMEKLRRARYFILEDREVTKHRQMVLAILRPKGIELRGHLLVEHSIEVQPECQTNSAAASR
jgi:hypothetical protein